MSTEQLITAFKSYWEGQQNRIIHRCLLKQAFTNSFKIDEHGSLALTFGMCLVFSQDETGSKSLDCHAHLRHALGARHMPWEAVKSAMRVWRRRQQPAAPAMLASYANAITATPHHHLLLGCVTAGGASAVILGMINFGPCLREAEYLIADGTFDTAPVAPQTYQMLTIHVIVSSRYFHSLIVLMENRTRFLYDAVFQLIWRLSGQPSPGVILTDYESALHAALQAVCPAARVVGCFFYFSQMSVAFAPRGSRPPVSPAQIQKMLDENAHLIQTIQEYQAKGQLMECHQYQQVLHRNLVYLASVADANQNIQLLLPPPHQLAAGNVPPGPHNAPSSTADMPGPSQQPYRPPTGVSTTPTRPTQSYGQRPYSQYQGQYQGTPGGYPPQGGYGPPNQGYGPPNPSQQSQGYPPNSSYGPPITTTPSNYPPSTHPAPGYPPSSGQQPYAPPPGSPAGAGSPYPVRGPSQPGYTGNSTYPPPQSGANYPPSGVSTYNSTAPQPQPYQSQPFPNTTPTSAYSSTPISQPNRSPQPPPSSYAQQNPTSSGYGSPSAQSPTYNSSSHANNPPASAGSGGPPPGGPPGPPQQYPPPGQQSPYPPASQAPYSNPSSQPGSPAPSVSTAPPPQTSYAQNPQSYPPGAGAYPPHAYQQGYPPAQYPPSPYPYARAPAPGAPPPGASQPYPGYGFQPPAQQ